MALTLFFPKAAERTQIPPRREPLALLINPSALVQPLREKLPDP